MKKFLSITFLLLTMLYSTAQTPIEVKIWPEGAPNPVENHYPDSLLKQNNLVLDPVLLVYPAAEPNGLAIVACPGGGYGYLAKYHEGTDMAGWYNDQGITYAVLLYRMPQGRHDVPVSDVHQSIRWLRANADRYGIEKVGVMGSSAGGHLASTAATHYDAATRPDFQILFYPVISLDARITHRGTRDNLLGAEQTPQMVTLYSNELQVGPDTPPAFIMHSSDDDVVPVENSLRYYRALTDAGVMSSLNIYPVGGHGWGFGDGFPYKPSWTTALKVWLHQIATQPTKGV